MTELQAPMDEAPWCVPGSAETNSRYPGMTMTCSTPLKLSIFFFFLFFLGIVLSFGLQTDYGQKVISLIQHEDSSKPAKATGPERFFPIHDRQRPRPAEWKHVPPQETIRLEESSLEGNSTSSEEPVPVKSGQASSETIKKKPARGKDTSPPEIRTEDEAKKQPAVHPWFSIQAGACLKKTNAQQVFEQLKKEGYEPTLFADQHADGSIWYKVRIGQYATEQDAEQALSSLQKTVSPDLFVISEDELHSPGDRADQE